MSITKVNTYLTDRNITNMALNVDYNRLGEDKTQITVNYGTSPATVTIKAGSIIECNGNRYLIDADYNFQMANAAHNYLTFTDNPAIAFSSAASIGTFDAEKQGYYQADNLTRTLKFYVDQSGEGSLVNIDYCSGMIPSTLKYDKIKVGISANTSTIGVLPLDTIYYDALGRFDTVNHKFTVVDPGYYYIGLAFYMGPSLFVRKNGNFLLVIQDTYNGSHYGAVIDYMDKDDYLQVHLEVANTIISGEHLTYFIIHRLL